MTALPRRAVAAILIALAGSLASPAGTTAPLLEEADRLAEAGRVREATVLLVETGQRLVHGGAPGDGADLLARARDLAPDVAAVRAALGYARLQQRRFDEAVDELTAARELGEGGAVLRLYLGSALWEQGRHDDAEREYRAALTEPGAPTRDVQQALGGLLLWQGRYTESVAILERAIAAGGDGPRARLDLARALEGAGRRDAAIDAYRRALVDAPGAFRARYNLARLLRIAGRTDEAQAEMDRFATEHAADQVAVREAVRLRGRMDLGFEHLRAGRPDEAARVFSGLPPTADVLAGLAEARSAAGDHGGALDALERALALAPNRADLRLRWARARVEAAGEAP